LQTVRTAYRNRARETHPDKNPGDEERAAKRFLEATKAASATDRRAEGAVERRARRAVAQPPPTRKTT
jgi:curved DNA-binding protein CbpA